MVGEVLPVLGFGRPPAYTATPWKPDVSPLFCSPQAMPSRLVSTCSTAGLCEYVRFPISGHAHDDPTLESADRRQTGGNLLQASKRR